MKKQLTYYFIFSICVGGSIYIAQKLEFLLPKLIRFYVNDFLIIPIVLYISLFVLRKLKNDKYLQFSLLHIFYVCVLYAVIFEYWLPKFHPRYTSDFIDVVLYFLSGILFYFLQKVKI
ncbi:MAG: hypothetical protein P8H13_03980 [Polaribacter sp.]|nr:hypothetical protein [Polaribacter sp.]MDG1811083.1 hypothetical protein [Polaribacter sp.]MDG1994409.1 hypothetical protein [Polaribacter sp.]